MTNRQNGGRVTAKGTRPKGTQPKLQDLAARAMAVQESVAAAKAAAAEAVVEGTALGGKVKVVLHGDCSPVSVTIDPSVVEQDGDMISDFVLIALREAYEKAQDLQDGETNSHLDAIGGIDLRAMGLDKIL